MTLLLSAKSAARPLSVIVADHYALTAHSLYAVVLQNRSEAKLAGHAASPIDAIRLCRQLKPDLLLIDAGMSPGSGGHIRQIRKVSRHTRVLVYAAAATQT